MTLAKSSLFAKTLGFSLLKAKTLIDTAVSASTQPFTQHNMVKPRCQEKFYSWTHYGIFIPKLPEPHRYLNIMILSAHPVPKPWIMMILLQAILEKPQRFFLALRQCQKHY